MLVRRDFDALNQAVDQLRRQRPILADAPGILFQGLILFEPFIQQRQPFIKLL